MTTPQHWDWSVTGWFRYTEEPPTITKTERTSDMPPTAPPLTYALQPDPAWSAAHIRHGAQIEDSRRGLTYRATIDPTTLELDHLEVVLSRPLGGLPASIPVERIQRVVRDQVIADERGRTEGVLSFVPVGGLADGERDGSRYKPPSATDLAELMNGGMNRQMLATHFDRPVRTVDGWIRKARAELGDDALPARSLRGRLPQGTTPGDRIRADLAQQKTQQPGDGEQHGR